jgi:hypothetical protein
MKFLFLLNEDRTQSRVATSVSQGSDSSFFTPRHCGVFVLRLEQYLKLPERMLWANIHDSF